LQVSDWGRIFGIETPAIYQHKKSQQDKEQYGREEFGQFVSVELVVSFEVWFGEGKFKVHTA